MGQCVAATAWQHVAVSAVNQTHLSFYIDGEPAGSFAAPAVKSFGSNISFGLNMSFGVNMSSVNMSYGGTVVQVGIQLTLRVGIQSTHKLETAWFRFQPLRL
jgi:hypothetical protein